MQLWEQVTTLPYNGDVSQKCTCNPQFNLKLYLNSGILKGWKSVQ